MEMTNGDKIYFSYNCYTSLYGNFCVKLPFKIQKRFLERTDFSGWSINRILFITVYDLNKILGNLVNIIQINDEAVMRLHKHIKVKQI